MHRPRAAVGDQREIAQIVATLHRHQTQRAQHRGIGDFDHAAGGLEQRQTEPARERVERDARALAVEANGPAVHARGIEVAQCQIRVGDGRFDAAEPVARGPRLRAGAARPDAQRAGHVHVGDRATAGADGLHGRHRQAHRIATELALRRRLGNAVGNEADVGRRAAHVEREGTWNAEHARHVRGGGDTGRRAGGRQRQRSRARRVDGHHAAGGVQQVQRGAFDPPAQLAHIRGGERHHGRVQDGRTRALVLTKLRVDIARDAHVRKVARQVLAQRALVLGVGVAVQQAYRHTLDVLALQACHELGDLIDLQRRLYRPVRGDPFGDLEPQPPRHRRRRLGRRLEIVEVQPARPRDLQHVPKSARGDQAHDRAAPLDDGVRHDRRTVRDRGDRVIAGERLKAAHDAVRRAGRRRRDFAARQPARRRAHDNVGKGAADVDADAAAGHAREASTGREPVSDSAPRTAS